MVHSSAALAQQLTYTTRIEARKVDDGPTVNPRIQQFYDRLSADLSGRFIANYVDEPVEFTYAVTEHVLRVQGTHEATFLQPGAVGILRPDRTWLVIRPDTRQYARLTPISPPSQRQGQNALSFEHTGEFADIAGVRAERVTFQNIFTNPAGELLSKLAGEPVIVSVVGDAWISTEHKKYADLLVGPYADAPFAFPLLNALQKEGLILRFVLRSPFFNGYEIERRVTRISEGSVVASLFEVPTDFSEIAPARFEQPQLISRTEASYTAEAAREKIDGEVVLQVTIGDDGSVRDPKVIKSLGYGLDEAAMKSVVQWKYRPGRKDGVPMNVVATINFRFTFRERATTLP